MVRGPIAGRVWPVSEKSLGIGRGMGCEIRLQASSISRVQCEIVSEGGKAFLHHRGASNPTLVNGAPSTHCELKLGDIVTLPTATLVVEVYEPVGAEVETRPTVTLKFEDVRLLQDIYERTQDALQAEDIHSLFGLVRRLSRQTVLDEIAQTLRAHMEERFESSECWVVGLMHSESEYTLFPMGGTSTRAAAPSALIEEVCAAGEGMVRQVYDVGGAVILAAAPVMHAGKAVGALTLRCPSYTDCGERELHYLLAAAECLSPFLRLSGSLTQLQLDSSRSARLPSSGSQMLGNSPAIHQLKGHIQAAARTRGNVLLLGETGVGKELAARMLHNASSRACGPYVVVNCAAVMESLFESEFFGHVAGAFTGAVGKRQGYFQQAHGGTLFLDEIGELSAAGQARLLRSVEMGTIRPVGAEAEIEVDVRVIAATNRNLAGTGTSFRFDLYNRLASMQVHLPPLRERTDDVLLLARHFLQLYAPDAPARPVSFSPEVEEELLRYYWPGNVRELRNVIERACHLANGDTIVDLGLNIQAHHTRIDAEKSTESLSEIERQHILRTLSQMGTVEDAAKALGLAKNTLYYRMGRMGISPPRKRRQS